MSTSSIPEETYLISYGASGTLGCFTSAGPTAHYARGTQVMVRTERGKETGTVLCLGSPQGLPAGLQLHPGQILGCIQQQEIVEQQRLNSLGQEVIKAANLIVNELFLPIKIIDVETVSDPDSVVLHLLLFGLVDLKALQTTLTRRCQVQVLLHDVTNPEALEEAAEGDCGSCGKNGGCESGSCGTGGCGAGSCGSGSSDRKFQDDWQDYFAELRKSMERRHE